MATDRLQELRDGLAIDQHNLDEELIRQPQLYYEVGQLSSIAVSRRDAAKDALKRLEAELYVETKRLFEKADKRVTENAVSAEIERNPRFVEARDRINKLTRRAAEIEALKDAYQQRSYVLKDLASLWIAGFYSNSSVSGRVSKDAQKKLYEEKKELIGRKLYRKGSAGLEEERKVTRKASNKGRA